jgi:hypothetical protein
MKKNVITAPNTKTIAKRFIYKYGPPYNPLLAGYGMAGTEVSFEGNFEGI